MNVVLLIIGLVATFVFGMYQEWFYELLRDRGIFPPTPTRKQLCIALVICSLLGLLIVFLQNLPVFQLRQWTWPFGGRSMSCPPTGQWVEGFEWSVPVGGESTVYLQTCPSPENVYELFKCLNPKVTLRYNAYSYIEFDIDTSPVEEIRNDPDNAIKIQIEDAGFDPQNQKLAPAGHYGSSRLSYNDSTYDGEFSFEQGHTYFIKVGNGLARIHVLELPPRSDYHEIKLIVSYVDDASRRFDGLTVPLPPPGAKTE